LTPPGRSPVKATVPPDGSPRLACRAEELRRRGPPDERTATTSPGIAQRPARGAQSPVRAPHRVPWRSPAMHHPVGPGRSPAAADRRTAGAAFHLGRLSVIVSVGPAFRLLRRDMNLSAYLRDVKDFPKPGIVFKDITPLLQSPAAMDETVRQIVGRFQHDKIDKVAGIESRGFIFGALVARELGVGFLPVRKPGKLPWRTQSVNYMLEYGSGTLEIHEDAITKGE